MLAIVSDLGWNDRCPAPASLKSSDLIERAPMYAGVELVLLGDTFDIVGSPLWLETSARPWDGEYDVAVATIVDKIVDRAIENHLAAIESLRATLQPTRVWYLVGDRDWPLCLPGSAYDTTRQAITAALGATSDLAFVHDPAEAIELTQCLRRNRVVARHGDIFDPVHFDLDRRSSSLGDVLAIELIGRFEHECLPAVAADLSQLNRAQFAAVRRPRAIESAERIAQAIVETADAAPRVGSRLIAEWNRLVDQLRDVPYLRSLEAWRPVDIGEALSSLLSIEANEPRSSARRAARAWKRLVLERQTRRHAALAEHDVYCGHADRIVYGHLRPVRKLIAAPGIVPVRRAA